MPVPGFILFVGTSGNDSLLGTFGDDNIIGGAGNDTLDGDFGSDSLEGGPGNDWLDGKWGSDTLDGGEGNDTLTPGLDGSAGRSLVPDRLIGGLGADLFVYVPLYGDQVVIADFSTAQSDRLDLSATTLRSFAEFLALGRQQGSDVVLDFGNNHLLTLQGMTLAAFGAIVPDEVILAQPVTTAARPLPVNDLAALDGGGYVTISNGSSQGTANLITATIYSATDTVLSSFSIATNGGAPNDGRTFLPGGWQQVAGLPGNRFVVAWDAINPVNGHAEIDARFFNADGTAVGPQFMVVDRTLSNTQDRIYGLQDVVALPNGDAEIRWNYFDNQSNSYFGKGQIFHPDGTPAFAVGLAATHRDGGYSIFAEGVYMPLADGHLLHYKLFYEGSYDNGSPWYYEGGSSPVEVPGRNLLLHQTGVHYGLYAQIDDNPYVKINPTGDVFPIQREEVNQLADGSLVFRYPGSTTLWTESGQFASPVVQGVYETTMIHLAADLHGSFINGTALADLLVGTSGADRIYGLGDNDTLMGLGGADLLDGGDGTDTADYSRSISQGVTVDLRIAGPQQGGDAEGDTLNSIENLVGSYFADRLTGNDGNNRLDGGSGNDTLDGRNGQDSLFGGAGDDQVTLLDTGEAHGGAGNDTITGGTQAGNTLFGDAGDDKIYALGVHNLVYGGGGNDTVYAGAFGDTIAGEADDDLLYGDAERDQLSGGDGNDRLYAAGANGDDLANVLTGGNGNDSLYGSRGGDHLAGDEPGGIAGDDSLDGGAGDDMLVSLGGRDTLVGGTGSDQALIDRSALALSFVLTLASANLKATANDGSSLLGIETFHFIGGLGDDRFTAMASNDTLEGGAGVDQLRGGGGDDELIGGAGADRLYGNAGNDAFYVDSAADRVFETIGEGDDTVFADGNFSLTPGAAVEHLWATGVTLGVTLKGNEFNNDIIGSGGFNDKLYGGAGDDTLLASDGLLDGGTGADSMSGYGDMTFVVDNPGDVVAVPFGGGIDLVQASISYALGADLENLTLTGADAIDGTGNALANRITGNVNANLLQGGDGIDNLRGGAGDDTLVGGTGNDVLTGGTGADAFRFYGFNFAFPPYVFPEGSDVITDFVPGQDRVELYANGWPGLPAPGEDLSGFDFFSGVPILAIGPSATAGGTQFVYNPANGKLYWDANGASAGGATLIATFSGAPALTGADIHVFI